MPKTVKFEVILKRFILTRVVLMRLGDALSAAYLY